MRLEVISPEEEVVAAFEMDPTPGATVAISGFHGSQVYPLSDHDTNLMVRFTGVENFESAPLEVPTDEEPAPTPTEEPVPAPADTEPAKAAAKTTK